MTYDSLLGKLRTVLAEDEASGGSYRNFRPLALRMLLDKSVAQPLFPTQLPDIKVPVEKEVSEGKFKGGRYNSALYGGASVDEASLCDAIADTAYAQLSRLQYVVAGPKPADEMERATAYTIAVYTVFAILRNGLSEADFRRLYDRSWENYFTLYTARAVREDMDTGWKGKYSSASVFYPLG